VAICDNNANSIVTFGSYGNVDQRGPLGSVPGPAVPLATPLCVAASDDYVYVADINNARLARVKMSYALNSLPWVRPVSVESDAGAEPATLCASPNPFNPMSVITVRLGSRRHLSLSVYNVSGRLVKVLASGNFRAGRQQFVWNATDACGKPVSAGVYIYRLAAGKQVMDLKTVLAK
jgi:hypothetical protein